jgi:hypothetical protein
VRPRRHVEEREQDLGARHRPLGEQLLVDAEELSLTDRGRGLELVHRARPDGQVHGADPPRDRPRGHQRRARALLVQQRRLLADVADHVDAGIAAVVRDDARA